MAKPLMDLTGQRFGRLTALQRLEKKDPSGHTLWLCRCDCGNETAVSTPNLRYGRTQSCGCMRRRSGRTATPEELGLPYPPQEDCAYCSMQSTSCTLLTELLCATRGSCSFFKMKEDTR